MTPERLAHIEVQLRRHPTSPHTVELALEVVEELKVHVALPPDAVAPRLVVADPKPTPETIPHVVPADVAVAIVAPVPVVEASDVAPTPPAAPARKGKR